MRRLRRFFRGRSPLDPVEYFKPPILVETDQGEWVVFWRMRDGRLAGMPRENYDGPVVRDR